MPTPNPDTGEGGCNFAASGLRSTKATGTRTDRSGHQCHWVELTGQTSEMLADRPQDGPANVRLEDGATGRERDPMAAAITRQV